MNNKDKSLRILYVGLKWDYGRPDLGLSYEYVNFYDTLRRMTGVEATVFPFDEEMRKSGRDGMNRKLLRVVQQEKPDVCFFVLMTDEIEPDTVGWITRETGTITLNWFGDDHYRFLTYSRHWAPLFGWVITTDGKAVSRYHAVGCRNVIRSQWGFNPHLMSPAVRSEAFDVTFVGRAYGNRHKYVRQLRSAGVDVQCWGRGWDNGRLSQADMYNVFARSRINLNFTESFVAGGWRRFARIVLSRRADDSYHINPPASMAEHIRTLVNSRDPQIKGRNFEVPGAGGFLLTWYADHLDEYFVPGREIGVFASLDECVDKVRYYLVHHDERESIRLSGYSRTRRDHTYEKRFLDIFRALGFNLASSGE
ncbi:MAG: glycosyltransferase [Bacteroidetes bacterium]|nr:glycosyltransferase [Bacteroidota bacterium]